MLLRVVLLVCAAAALAQDFTQLQLKVSGIQPEGLCYSEAQGFLVGSIASGTIYRVSDFDGSVTGFSSANGRLQSSVGIHAENPLERLYVTNHPDGSPLQNPSPNGELVVIDLITGGFQSVVDLSDLGARNKPKLLNDVAVHPNGRAWVSDSFRGNIYAVDIVARKAELLVHSAEFEPQDELGIGINGIEYYRGDDDEDQWLIAARSGTTEESSGLFRVDIETGEIRRILIRDNGLDDVLAFDGLDMDRETGALWATTAKNVVYELTSDNDWIDCDLVGVWPISSGIPTSIDYLQKTYHDAYVITNSLGNGPYTIERVKLKNLPISSSGASALCASLLAAVGIFAAFLF